MSCNVTPLKKYTEISYRVKCVSVENERVFGDVYVTQQTRNLLYCADGYQFPSLYGRRKCNLILRDWQGPDFMELNKKKPIRRASIAQAKPPRKCLKRSKSVGDTRNMAQYDSQNNGTAKSETEVRNPKMYPSPLPDAPLRKEPSVSSLVDQLLLDIYGLPDGDRGRSESDSTASSLKARPQHRQLQKARLLWKSKSELQTLIENLRDHIRDTGGLLIRQLRRKDYLSIKRQKQCDIITAFLQAHSRKHIEDTKMRFSLTPQPGESGFIQWLDAMKMVARLQGGIPPEFRKKLWLTLAERHLEQRGVDWKQAEKVCFNEWSNPDDEELGIQIVKDLHRTGCSLFCGAAGRDNQAVLRRVLLGFARWNKSVGYCQGLNVLAALVLQVMDRAESAAVKVMIYLIEGVLPEGYFADNLRGLSVDMAVFRDLLRTRLPKLSKHLEALQTDAKDKATGSSYEPPLTNVFTMQWFLTLFCHCLPQEAVLRVWDLIFIEGDEILLRTALTIWEGLSDRIMTVTSADEFYSIMGVLTREMPEFTDTNTLIKNIVSMGPLQGVTGLREKHRYNITPWARKLSDDDDSDTEEDERLAVAAAMFSMAQRLKKDMLVDRIPQTIGALQAMAPSSDRERLALDISTLKQQYAKLRERQRQAHIILSAACARQTMVPPPTSQAMNHLLVGKNALVSGKNRPLRLPSGTAQAMTRPTPLSQNRRDRQGITLHWKDTKKAKQKAALSPGAVEATAAQPLEADLASPKRGNGDSDSDSTSTELCDEPDRLSDVDSEDLTSASESYVMATDEEKTSRGGGSPMPEKSLGRSSPEDKAEPASAGKKQDSGLTEENLGDMSIAKITDQIRRLSAEDDNNSMVPQSFVVRSKNSPDDTSVQPSLPKDRSAVNLSADFASDTSLRKSLALDEFDYLGLRGSTKSAKEDEALVHESHKLKGPAKETQDFATSLKDLKDPKDPEQEATSASVQREDTNLLADYPTLLTAKYDQLLDQPTTVDATSYERITTEKADTKFDAKQKNDVADKTVSSDGKYGTVTEATASLDTRYDKIADKTSLLDRKYDEMTEKSILLDRKYDDIADKATSLDTKYNKTGETTTLQARLDQIADKTVSLDVEYDRLLEKPSLIETGTGVATDKTFDGLLDRKFDDKSKRDEIIIKTAPPETSYEKLAGPTTLDAKIDVKIDAISNRVSPLQTKFDKVAGIAKLLDTKKDEIADAKYDQVSSKTTSLDSKYDKITDRVAPSDTRYGKVSSLGTNYDDSFDTKYDKITEKASLDTKYDKIAEKASLDTKYDKITEKASLNTKYDKITEKALLDTKYDKIAEKASLDTKYDKITEKASLDTKYDKITEKASLDTKYDKITEKVPLDTKYDKITEKASLDTKYDKITDKALLDTKYDKITEKVPLDTKYDKITEKASLDTKYDKITDKALLDTKYDKITEKASLDTKYDKITEKASLDTKYDKITDKTLLDTKYDKITEKASLDTKYDKITEKASLDTKYDKITEKVPLDTKYDKITEKASLDTKYDKITEKASLDTKYDKITEKASLDTKYDKITEKAPLHTKYNKITEKASLNAKYDKITGKASLDAKYDQMMERTTPLNLKFDKIPGKPVLDRGYENGDRYRSTFEFSSRISLDSKGYEPARASPVVEQPTSISIERHPYCKTYVGHLPISPVTVDQKLSQLTSVHGANNVATLAIDSTSSQASEKSYFQTKMYSDLKKSPQTPESNKSFNSAEITGVDAKPSGMAISPRTPVRSDSRDYLMDKSVSSSVSSDSKTLVFRSGDSDATRDSDKSDAKRASFEKSSSLTPMSTDSLRLKSETSPKLIISSSSDSCSPGKMKSSERSFSSDLQSPISANSIKYTSNYNRRGQDNVSGSPMDLSAATSPFYPISNPNQKTPPSPYNVSRRRSSLDSTETSPEQKSSSSKESSKYLGYQSKFDATLKSDIKDLDTGATRKEEYRREYNVKKETLSDKRNGDSDVHYYQSSSSSDYYRKDKELDDAGDDTLSEKDVVPSLPLEKLDKHYLSYNYRHRDKSKMLERSSSSLESRRFADMKSSVSSDEFNASMVKKRSSDILEDIKHLEAKASEGSSDSGLLALKSYMWEDLKRLEARRQDTFTDSASTFSKHRLEIPNISVTSEGRKSYIVHPMINIDENADSILNTVVRCQNNGDSDDGRESKLGVWTKVKPRKRSDNGRRNSDRALKIIQENSVILQKILACQAKKRLPDLEEISKEISISPINEEISKIFSPILEKMGLNEHEINEELARINFKDFDNMTATSVSEFDAKINEELSRLSLIDENEQMDHFDVDEVIAHQYSDRREALIDRKINEELSKLLLNYEDRSPASIGNLEKGSSQNVSEIEGLDLSSISTNVFSYKSSNDSIDARSDMTATQEPTLPPEKFSQYVEKALPYNVSKYRDDDSSPKSDIDIYRELEKLDQISSAQVLPHSILELPQKELSSIPYVPNTSPFDDVPPIRYTTKPVQYDASPLKSAYDPYKTFDFKPKLSPKHSTSNPFACTSYDQPVIDTAFEYINNKPDLSVNAYEGHLKSPMLTKESLEFRVRYDEEPSRDIGGDYMSLPTDLVMTSSSKSPYYSNGNTEPLTPTKYASKEERCLDPSRCSFLEYPGESPDLRRKYESLSPKEYSTAEYDRHLLPSIEAASEMGSYLPTKHLDYHALSPNHHHQFIEQRFSAAANHHASKLSPGFADETKRPVSHPEFPGKITIGKYTELPDRGVASSYQQSSLSLGNIGHSSKGVENNYNTLASPKTPFSPFPVRNAPRKPNELTLKLGLYPQKSPDMGQMKRS